MAGKKGMMRRAHQDDVRTKIQCSQLIRRLQEHVDGKLELSATQIQAAKILLDKAMSNAPTDMNVQGSLTAVLQHGDERLL